MPKLTKHQIIAFERPRVEAEQCAAQDYCWLRLPWSAILTLNVGLDDASTFDGSPLWHCSVALVDLKGHPRALPFGRKMPLRNACGWFDSTYLQELATPPANRLRSALALFTSDDAALIRRLGN